MSKFKVGDKVRRKDENHNVDWREYCRASGVSPVEIFTVRYNSRHKPHSISLYEIGVEWYDANFDLVPQRSRKEIMEEL